MIGNIIYISASFLRLYLWHFLLAGLILVIYKWWSYPVANFPPGVRGYPILGAFPYFGRHPEKVIAKWSREIYGPVMSVRFGIKDFVVINDYDTLHEAFITKAWSFRHRPSIPTIEAVTKGLGFTFRLADKEWKIQRNFAMNRMKEFGPEQAIKLSRERLIDSIKKKQEVPFNISSYIGTAVCNVVCHIAFGKQFDMEDERLQRLLKNIFDLYGDPKESEGLSVTFVYPKLQHIPKFKKLVKSYHQKLGQILSFIEEEIQQHEVSEETEVAADYVQSFLQAKKLYDAGNGFTDLQLRMALHDFFVAGTETTTSTILWGLLCLIHYPDIQSKLEEEICSFKLEEDILWEDRLNLPYASAFIQELLRFRSAIPLGLTHETANDVELSGYKIPAKTTIMANIWSIHNDPKLWNNPEKFDPDRHLDNDGIFVYSKKIIPFLIGPRSCPGEKLARMELFLFFINLVKDFKFTSDPSSPDLPVLSDGVKGFFLYLIPINLLQNHVNSACIVSHRTQAHLNEANVKLCVKCIGCQYHHATWYLIHL